MRTVSLEELTRRLAQLPGRPRVVASGNAAIPWAGVRAVDEALEEYTLHVLNAPPGLPERPGVTAETCFVGAGMRHHPGLSYVPSRLSLVPVLLQRMIPADVVLLHCAPPRDGLLSLGVEVNVLPAAIEGCLSRGGLVVAVVNDRMPYTYGDAQVHLDQVSLAVEVSDPIPAVTAGPPGEDSRRIGDLVAARVPDGATLQLGIGAVPDATLAALTERRDLRVWTEMFSDGVLALEERGVLDRSHPLTTSFLFGSQELYDWADGNERVRMLRTERTNDPAMIARQRLMTSVNTALEVDLFGQANASRINRRIHSGFGGQTDFIVGAMHAPGGQAFIALRSWHPKANVSTIVPLLDEPVTSFQQTAVVTEQGVAEVAGYSEKAQARHIIRDAAHPDVKEQLWEEAGRLGLA
ncbi:acetyl-CoA hydrolase/transferase family protein [Nocardioides marmoribigeumensis]|uniref:Acyl-CoA hydrolase n=1 Tax=Nocardioides marmoribigeumensis TaxID=433649 RepID=A0ABU2BTQ5_9ACTN|nr:acetyl-CoA hydrolase/transferase C-terminal domain-containing protein [Nocardioides marmoribigeumensis]MDR7360754.1 acyl-CoA hydrolase [Nocardioides marmoribigeumensis]